VQYLGFILVFLALVAGLLQHLKGKPMTNMPPSRSSS